MGITRIADLGTSVLPLYAGAVISTGRKILLLLLFCHCTLSGNGHENTLDLIVALDPKKPVDSTESSTRGMSTKIKILKIDQIEILQKLSQKCGSCAKNIFLPHII